MWQNVRSWFSPLAAEPAASSVSGQIVSQSVSGWMVQGGRWGRLSVHQWPDYWEGGDHQSVGGCSREGGQIGWRHVKTE